MTETQARALRQILVNGSASLTDAAVSMDPECLDRMTYDGSLINHGTRINWGGEIKRAAVDLWDREDNDPDHAPTLWEDVLYRKGYRIIPETITVGLAFSSGEIGWWGDVLYRSKVDNNVYTPDQYAPNWELVEDNTGGEQQ